MIESDKLRPGSRVTLTPRELNAYVATEVHEYAPVGVRETKVELGNGSVSGAALIDFLKLRQASGQSTGWAMSKLLAGERPLRVTSRIQSHAGQAQWDFEGVEISGRVVHGKM